MPILIQRLALGVKRSNMGAGRLVINRGWQETAGNIFTR